MAIDISQLIASAKSKVGKVAQKFDRDQSMPGFQFAQGGLGNKVKQFGTNLVNSGAVGFGPSKLGVGIDYSKGLSDSGFTPMQSSFKPAQYASDRITNYINNTYLASARDVPKAIEQIKQPGFGNKAIGVGRLGLDVLGAVPDPTDLAFAGYNYLKGTRAYGLQNPEDNGVFNPRAMEAGLKSATYEKPVGLGEALTTNKTLADIGNIAELPAVIAYGGLKAKSAKTAQEILKHYDGVVTAKNYLTNLENLSPKLQMDAIDQVRQVGSEVIPDILKRKEMQTLENKDIKEWMNTAVKFMEDRMVKAANPEINVGFKTEAIKRLDTPKLSVEPTGNNVYSDAPKITQDAIEAWKSGQNIGGKRFRLVNEWLSKKGYKLGNAGEDIIPISPSKPLSVEPVWGKVEPEFTVRGGAKYYSTAEVMKNTRPGTGNYEVGEVYFNPHPNPDPYWRQFDKNVIVAGPEVDGKIPTLSWTGNKGVAGMPPDSAMPELTPKDQLKIVGGKVEPVGGKDLLSEARKYKSAEEFYKAQPKLFRYGGELDLTKGYNKGISFTPKAQQAIDYQYSVGGAIRPGGKLTSALINPNAKILKTSDIPTGVMNTAEQDYDSLIKYARSKGYDAVEIGNIAGENEIRVLNPKVLTTQKEAYKIYNEAQSSPLGGKVGGEVTSLPAQELPTQVKSQEATALEVKPPLSQSLEQTPKTSQVETKPVVESKPLDNIISNESKQRGFLETVQESPKTRKGTKVKTKALPQEYGVVGNKGEVKKADKLISMDVDEAKRSLLAGEVTGVNETVLGIRLAKHYEKTKQLDSAVDVIEHLDRQLRESGRAIQAASLWNKMSPEAILRSANRVAEKLGKQLDDVTKQTIVKRMGEVSKMPEGEAKQKATVEVLNYIADKLPPSFGDNFEAYRYTNMLSSPKSHERNIYNNLFNTLITRPADIAIQSIYDIAKHPNNPVARDVSLSDVPRYYKHVFTSFGNAMEAAKEGMKNQPLTADLQGNAAIEQIRKGKVAKPLQIIPKFMQAQDSFFSTLIASGEKARLLKHGLSEEAANKGAKEIAESYLLRDKLGKSTDKGYIVRALDSLGKLALEGRRLPVVGKAWSWFVPFVTTPINAAKMMVEHSVLGLPGAKMSSENLAKATVGSMITAYGAMLAAQDKVTWEAPTDQKQKEMYYASGKKPFSILVGDKWVPAWYLGPYALALMMPAAVKQYNDESPTALTDDQVTKLGRAVSSISKFIVSQTPLSGVGGFFSLLEGDSDYTISNLMGGTATQAIPLASMQRYINTIIDPIYRKGSNFEAQIKKSLLGQTEGLKPYLTPTGEESKRLPANAVLPYDIGQRDLRYEPYERARRDKLQQNKQINLAKKQAQDGKPVSAAGGVYFNMDGSTVDVGKVASMPSTSGFGKVKKQEATYKILDDVLKLPIDQQEEALKKLDITPYQAQYYQVSNSSVEAKTAFVQDQIESMINSGSTRNDVIGQLIKLREDVNGTQIASDNVLKKLVDQNIISQQDYNNLKQVKLENGQIKRKVTGRAKKVKMPKYNYEALKLKTVYKPKRVKIRRIKI